MTAPEVNFDHDEIAAAVKSIRALADRVEEELPRRAQACVDKARAESGRNTRSGAPAPIYTDMITAAQASADHVARVAATIAGNYRTIAAALENGNDVSEALAERTAALIADADADTIKPGPLLGGAA